MPQPLPKPARPSIRRSPNVWTNRARCISLLPIFAFGDERIPPSLRDRAESSVVPLIASRSNAPPTVTIALASGRRLSRASTPVRVIQSELL